MHMWLTHKHMHMSRVVEPLTFRGQDSGILTRPGRYFADIHGEVKCSDRIFPFASLATYADAATLMKQHFILLNFTTTTNNCFKIAENAFANNAFAFIHIG